MKKNINRLTQAAYASNSEQWNGDLLAMNDRNFSCTYAYDLNSNMTALQRYGVDVYNTSLPTHIRHHGMIDDLTMTYDGNRVKKVTDQCEELSYAGAMDFKDGADKDEEYTYDANGNMTRDRNKGIHIPKGRFFWYAYDALTYIGAVSKHAEGISLRCDVICAIAYCGCHESSHIIKAHTDSTRFNEMIICGNLWLIF